MKRFLRTYGLLSRLQLRMRISQLNPFAQQNTGTEKNHGIRRLIGILVLFIALGAMIVVIEFRILDALMTLHAESLILGIVVMAAMISTLFFGLFEFLSTLYFAKDTGIYAALPITDRSLYASRATISWCSECLVSTLMILPVMILYMIRVHFDAGLLFRTLVVMLTVPLIPLSLSACLCRLLASFSVFSRHKDTFVMIGSLVLVIGQVVLNYSLGQFTGNLAADPLMMVRLLTGKLDLIESITKAFPPVKWAAHGLQGNIPELLLYLGVTVACVILVIFICGKNYLQLALRSNEHAVSKRSVNLSRVSGKKTPALLSLYHREMHEILRSPTYLLNEIMGTIFMPIIMTVGMAFGFASSFDGNLGLALSEMFGSEIGTVIPAAVITALMTFMAGMNSVTSTSVSREGNRHALYKAIPVRGQTILLAKLLSGLVFSVIGLFLPVLIGILFLPAWRNVFLLAGFWSLLLVLFDSAVGVCIDTARPKFHWNSEQEAMKQNFNQVLAMLLGMAVIMALGFLTWFMLSRGISPQVYCLIISGLLLLLDAASLIFMLKKSSIAYEHIDG